MRTRPSKPFTKDTLEKDICQVREKLGIPEELKLGDLRRTAWTEMADGGATVPELAASAGWSMNTAGMKMVTYRTWTPILSRRAHLPTPFIDAGKRT